MYNESAMSAKLPFVSQPTPETVIVGDKLSGTLEIRKLGDLTPNERIYIKEQTKHLPDLRTEAVRVAKAIALATKKPLLEVYTALTSSDTISLSENLEELLKFQELMEVSGRERPLTMATAIIRYRVNREWTLADTTELMDTSPRLVAHVAEFAQKEESGWTTEVEPVTEEALKKQTVETSENQTGETYSGAAPDSTPTIPDSVPSSFETSLAG